jgi:hypothetical protein
MYRGQVLGKTVRYNVIPTNTQLIDNTSIVADKQRPLPMSTSPLFFLGFHLCVIHPPRLEHRFPRPYMLPHRDWPIEG